jgi:hypothetical protein
MLTSKKMTPDLKYMYRRPSLSPGLLFAVWTIHGLVNCVQNLLSVDISLRYPRILLFFTSKRTQKAQTVIPCYSRDILWTQPPQIMNAFVLNFVFINKANQLFTASPSKMVANNQQIREKKLSIKLIWLIFER